MRYSARAESMVAPVIREVFTAAGRTAFDDAAIRMCQACTVRVPCAACAATADVAAIWGGRRRHLPDASWGESSQRRIPATRVSQLLEAMEFCSAAVMPAAAKNAGTEPSCSLLNG